MDYGDKPAAAKWSLIAPPRRSLFTPPLTAKLRLARVTAVMTPDVTAFFHDGTYTITYVVSEPEGEHCAIVDSVLDYDPVSGRTSTNAADTLIDFLRERRPRKNRKNAGQPLQVGAVVIPLFKRA